MREGLNMMQYELTKSDYSIIDFLKGRYDYISKYDAIQFLKDNGYNNLGLSRFRAIYDACFYYKTSFNI